jgi:hypothetical protein
MQRIIPILVAMAGCYVDQTTPRYSHSASDDYTNSRPLVTDQLPYYATRDEVRAWHDQHGWCRRRTWSTTDEFYVCDQVRPYYNRSTPPMYSMVKYDDGGRAVAYAMFTPVPCNAYGRCDRIYGRTVYASEHDFVDHQHGLYDHLADRGRAVEPEPVGLPDMQQRMFDALETELARRFGAPTWSDARRYGATWMQQGSEIGLFVGGSGGWVVETHEILAGEPNVQALNDE